MKKISVMQITHDLNVGGLQQVIVHLCRLMDRERFRVSVLCLNELGPFATEIEKLGIELLLLPDTKNKDYFAFLKVAKIFREKRPDILHTHNTQPFLDSVMASLISGVGKIIHTDHARNFPDKKRYMLAERIASYFAEQVVGVSEHTSKNLNKYEKIPLRKILTIPNGIDENIFQFSLDREKEKQKLGIHGNGPLIGLGVRLTAQKGVNYLLQSLPEVLKYYPELTLVIAGDGPLRNILEEQGRSLNIQERVKFLGITTDMPKILKLLDLYVLPSIWEGLPMVILEALAAGCPVLATDVGGNATAIQHGHNGSLVASKNPAALSQEIIRLLGNPLILRKYSSNGRKIFHSKFSAHIMAQRYQSLYLQAVQQ